MLGPLERFIEDLSAHDGGAALERARARFHERTGPFEVGDPWYEERISFFFEWVLCDDGGAAHWLELHPSAKHEDRRLAQALLTSARSLYRVASVDEREVRVDDMLGGGRFALSRTGTAERLAEGETFDGRIVAQDVLHLASGIIFHPPSTHEPLEALVEHLQPLSRDREEVLDGLLRMRMRLDRFESIRAKHIYRLESLDDQDILSAGWARRA